MQTLERYYVAIWCMFMPVTSLLIIPVVQGTIIPYVFALGSIVFVLCKVNSARLTPPVVGYFKSLFMVGLLWTVLFVGSQLSDIINPVDVQSMFTISGETGLLMRQSLFTQSIYFLACVMIALYFRYFLPEAWTKYVYWGAWFFAIYGLYDWLFFLLFHVSGDFIANRTFSGGDHPGSWTQTIQFGPLQLMRLKSCLGEPSFTAAVVIPYILMAFDGNKKILAVTLLICALLTTSTTVYLGMAFAFFMQMMLSKRNRGPGLVALIIVGVAILAMAVLFPDTYRSLFEDKFSGDTASGKIRLGGVEDYLDFFTHYDIFNWIFGVGFGYLYFTLAWSLTANTGILGDSAFLYTMLKPAYYLPTEKGSEWLKISMLTLVGIVLISVSELFIPTTWMFIGLAYRRLDQIRAQRTLPNGFSTEGAFATGVPVAEAEPVGLPRSI